MAARSFVVDASAMAKALGSAPGPEQAAAAFRQWLQAAQVEGVSLLAPHILRYELGNVLARAARQGADLPAALRRRMLGLALLGFTFADGDTAETHAPPLSFHDASYLALARATDAVLVTYDAVLAQAAHRAGLQVLAPA